MVQVMKIIASSFKRSHAGTAALNLPKPRADHGQPTPLPGTPEHSQASLGHLLWGHCSFLCTKDFVCAIQESVSPVL